MDKDNLEVPWGTHSYYNPMVHEIQIKLKCWHKTFLSWTGRIHLVKSFIFPKFLFLFRTLAIPIPHLTLNKWQQTLSGFLWAFKHHRIKNVILMRPTQWHCTMKQHNLSMHWSCWGLLSSLRVGGKISNWHMSPHGHFEPLYGPAQRTDHKPIGTLFSSKILLLYGPNGEIALFLIPLCFSP